MIGCKMVMALLYYIFACSKVSLNIPEGFQSVGEKVQEALCSMRASICRK